ncbi:hypothetical protein CRG98_047427 [Punica granatum]|uniref:Disease resistance protein RGA3 n=1 Tax=Punica granatum TaxID=22663 RepID=A0A2I0HKK2_PUNGR|nr:hypothetical protein CRG98_047427 [Punica granatum]
MAEVVLGGVVESVTGHLVSLISQEIRLACGVRAELEKLQTTVSVIGGMLREADKRRVEAEDVKEWLKKLKELFYDADDLLDDFSTEVLRRRRVMVGGKRILNEVSIFFSFSNQLFYAIKMAHRVKEIRGRIDAIWNDRHACFHLEGNSNLMGSLEENQTRSETYSFEPEMYVVGRDKEKKEVMEFLLNPDFEESVSIVPIVGVGGQGKTTLARKVFNDDKVKEYFEMRLIWVCVSTSFSVKDILRKIVRECSPNKEGIANLDMNELRKKLGEWINGKKYLLVLDDVWNDNRSKWLELQGFLMSGAKGSKILVTTRSTRVAETMTRKFYKLSGLPSDESLSLLMQMAMKEEHEWKNQNLEKIAREIVKKCAGIPLAIKTIGRLLVFSGSTEEDWLNFKDNDLSLINQEEDDIMPTLKLSYDFLPSHLKPCFAYCSLFPQDYELEPRSKKTLEEVGYDYFRELLSRSFFQDMQVDLYGDIMSCRMHDLMHDLARSLRALRICGGHIKVISRSIAKLKHLRSLDLSKNDGFRYLPNSISKLCNLESLNLTGCRDLKELPSGITKLVNLRQLRVRGCYNLRDMPRGIGKLTNLQMLDVFVGGEKLNRNAAELNELSKLTGLREKLTIQSLERVESSSISSEVNASFSMEKLADLQCLRLCWRYFRDLLRLAGWRMRNVTALLLHQHDPRLLPLGPQRPMAVLVPTDSSPSTIIKNQTTLTAISDSISLAALTSLSISEIKDAKQLPVQLFQSLPSLQSLKIKDCPGLKALPLGAILRYLSNLETLEISGCKKLDLSTEDDDDDDDGGNAEGMTNLLQLHGHHKLRHLEIRDCKGLKSLPRRVFLPLLTTLESLALIYCPELDLSMGESKVDEEDMPMPPNLQFTKVRKLEIRFIAKLETLPWWIQHLTNLESLVIHSCKNLKALPEWLPNLISLRHLGISYCGEELTGRCQENTGEDWPKISHIQRVLVEML